MMTISQISLILFVAVTFGAAQEFTESEAEKAVDHCYEISYFDESACLDYDAIEKCTKNIAPKNDEDREMVTGTLEYLMERKTACPAFADKSKCIQTEVNDCMESFLTLKYSKEKEVCNSISNASSCLIKFNDTCNANVIEFELQELDEVRVQCLTGHWDDGECSPIHVFNCTTAVLNDFNYDEQDNPVGQYACKSADVVKAKRCLSDYKQKCTAKDQVRDVDEEWGYLNDVCPPA